METKTHLQILKEAYDAIGIQYHELIDNGYTYIQKLAAHDKPGHIFVGYRLIPLVSSSQLTEFFEFDKNGEIASW